MFQAKLVIIKNYDHPTQFIQSHGIDYCSA